MLNGTFKIQNLKLQTNTKMTHVMCNPWKMTFTLMPLDLLPVFSPKHHNVRLLEHTKK